MSRRSRRNRGSANTRVGWVVRFAVFFLVVAIGVGAVGYGLIRSYLHSDGFRVLLSRQVSEALAVDGAFGPLQWDGLATQSSRFEGEGGGDLLAIRADDLRTEIGLDGFRDGYWLLKSSVVRNLEVTIDARSSEDKESSPPPDVASTVDPPTLPDVKPKRPWFPSEIRYDTVNVENFSATIVLDESELLLKNHRVRAEATAGSDAVDFIVRGGTVNTPLTWLPELRVDEINARYRDGAVFVTSGQFRVFENGLLDAAGEWDEATGAYAFQGAATGIECADLLDDDWARRLSGQVLLDYSIHENGEGLRAMGTMEIRDGVLTALPLLDSLSAYADTQRFRTLTLHEARADWSWADGHMNLTNIRLTSEGLVRIEGTLVIDNEGELDGNFRLGLAPGTLSRIPGAETMVFQPGEHGLMWAPLRITGTADKLREDLTDRLIAAAGMRMLEILPETGERVLRNTRTLINELPQGTVDRALELIGRERKKGGESGGLLREAGNLLEGVLRGAGREQPRDEEDP